MKWYMNEERELLQKAFREFAQQRVRPYIDKMEREDAGCRDLLLEMGQLGFYTFGKPERLGGAGEDRIPIALLLEELSRESYTVALSAMIQHLFIQEIIKDCNEEQIQKFAVPAMNGEIVLGLAANEPNGSMDFGNYGTTAVKDGNEWVINGNKCLITLVDISDVFVVTALVDGKMDPVTFDGYASFIVPANTPGVTFGHIEKKVGWNGSRTGTVYFNDVRIPAENKTANPMYLGPALGLGGWYGAMDLGGAEVCIEKAVNILKNREQNGATLWDSHEVIRNNVAELLIKVKNFRNSVYGLMADLSLGEANLADDYAVKIEGVKLLRDISHECMTLSGGMGLIYETGIERYYRDCVISDIACCSSKTALSWIAATI